MSKSSERYFTGLMILLSAAAVVGCGDDEEGNTGGAGTGGAGTGGNTGGLGTSSGFLQTECGTCLSGTCAGELGVCQAEPGCSEHVDCIAACPTASSGHVDPTCAQACPLPDSTAALDASDALIACWYDGPGVSCEACGLADVPVPEVLQQECAASSSADMCFQCLDEQCCDTAIACLGTPGCGDLIDCINACSATDVPCNAACYENATQGDLDAYLQFSNCAGYLCAAPCGAPPGDCTLCGQTQCETPGLACDLDPDCFLIGVCIAQCDQPTGCFEMCTAGKPADSVTTFETLSLCLRHLCSDECGGQE